LIELPAVIHGSLGWMLSLDPCNYTGSNLELSFIVTERIESLKHWNLEHQNNIESRADTPAAIGALEGLVKI
jgi:hypothetical protein